MLSMHSDRSVCLHVQGLPIAPKFRETLKRVIYYVGPYKYGRFGDSTIFRFRTESILILWPNYTWSKEYPNSKSPV